MTAPIRTAAQLAAALSAATGLNVIVRKSREYSRGYEVRIPSHDEPNPAYDMTVGVADIKTVHDGVKRFDSIVNYAKLVDADDAEFAVRAAAIRRARAEEAAAAKAAAEAAEAPAAFEYDTEEKRATFEKHMDARIRKLVADKALALSEGDTALVATLRASLRAAYAKLDAYYEACEAFDAAPAAPAADIAAPAPVAKPAAAKAAIIDGWRVFNWFGYDAKGVAAESPAGAVYSAYKTGELGKPETWKFGGLERVTNFGDRTVRNRRVIAFIERNYDALCAGADPAELQREEVLAGPLHYGLSTADYNRKFDALRAACPDAEPIIVDTLLRMAAIDARHYRCRTFVEELRSAIELTCSGATVAIGPWAIEVAAAFVAIAAASGGVQLADEDDTLLSAIHVRDAAFAAIAA